MPADEKGEGGIEAVTSNPWTQLRRFTPARIALGRAGGSQPTSAVLDFRLAQARARDAVHAPLDTDALERDLHAAGFQTERLSSRVSERRTFLERPDLGRRLAPASHERLATLAPSVRDLDLALIVSDGLSAAAVERHAAPTLAALADALRGERWTLSPVFVAPLARVKLQDEVGERLGARFSLMLLGERPGLGSPDSLSAYLTARPGASRTDADRNCVSNIRPGGISPLAAAATLAWLLREARRTGLSGLRLKLPDLPSRASPVALRPEATAG